ncbi:MAG: hypothetical protein U0795_27055 [Pirellulales bacterium]
MPTVKKLDSMGRFLKDVHFWWSEPLAVKRLRCRIKAVSSESKKFRGFQFLVWLLVVGAFGLLSVVNGQNAPRPMPLWGALLIGSGCGFLIAYVVPWVSTVTSSSVFVNEDGIYRSSGQNYHGWKFDRIKSCALARTNIDGQAYDLLVITDLHDQTHVVGLARSISAEQLKNKLRDLGVTVTESPAVVSSGHSDA